MGAELYQNENSGQDDVRRMLVNHVCMYKGEPVFVTRSSTHRVNVSYLKDPFVVETIDYRVAEFTYKSPPLGYLNWQGEAFYLTRTPAEGYHSPALSMHALKIPEALYPKIDTSRFLQTKELAVCIKGEHPSFADAIKAVREGEATSMAFHRHFAIDRRAKGRCVLEKRGLEEIGLVKDKTIIIFDERQKPAIETLTKGSDFNVSHL